MSETKRVVKNSAFTFTTNMLSKILTLVMIIFLARYLGVEGYGKLSFVLSFTGLFAVFGNFGLSILLNRLVAREKKKVSYYFSNALVISAILNIITFAVIMLFAWMLRYDDFTIRLIFIGALFIIFQNFKTPFQSVYEAFEKMQYVFWTRLSKVVLRLGLVMLFIYLDQGLEIILIIYALVELIMIFADFWVYNKYIEQISLVKKLINVEQILSEKSPELDENQDEVYLLPYQYIKGYIDSETGAINRNELFEPNYEPPFAQSNIKSLLK